MTDILEHLSLELKLHHSDTNKLIAELANVIAVKYKLLKITAEERIVSKENAENEEIEKLKNEIEQLKIGNRK